MKNKTFVIIIILLVAIGVVVLNMIGRYSEKHPTNTVPTFIVKDVNKPVFLQATPQDIFCMIHDCKA